MAQQPLNQSQAGKPPLADNDIAEGVAVPVSYQGERAISPSQIYTAQMPYETNSVPILKWTSDMDPAIRCQIAGCSNVGNSVCHWTNMGACRKEDGGCGKRYCYQHRYEKSVEWYQLVYCTKKKKFSFVCISCTNCGAEVDQAIERNGKFLGRLYCGFVVGLIMTMLLLNLMLQIVIRLNY